MPNGRNAAMGGGKSWPGIYGICTIVVTGTYGSTGAYGVEFGSRTIGQAGQVDTLADHLDLSVAGGKRQASPDP